jgi:hypothetical protein
VLKPDRRGEASGVYLDDHSRLFGLSMLMTKRKPATVGEILVQEFIHGADLCTADATSNIELPNPLHCAQHPARGRPSILLGYIGVSDQEPIVAGGL